MKIKIPFSAESTEIADDHFFLPNFCRSSSGAEGSVFILVLVSELLALLLVLAKLPYLQGTQFWYELALSSLYIQWISLSSAAVLCGLRTRLMHWPSHRAALFSYGFILLDTLLVGLVSQWALAKFHGSMADYFDYLELLKQMLMSGIVGGLVLRYFYVQQQLHQQQKATLIHRLQALQSRIRPHFLFNSMNSIASLIATNPALAEEVVEDLAELFRAALHRVGDQVPLVDELELCRRYVHIEQLRLAERLTVDWQIGDNIPASAQIPLLTLQPLLENAIYHGIQQLPDGGIVNVILKYDAPRLTVKVINPCPLHRLKPKKGHRMALENIQHRLQALYGEHMECLWKEAEGQFEVSLSYSLNSL